MTDKHQLARLVMGTIGWPIGSGPVTPSTDQVTAALKYVFKNRLGLLFLETCVQKGVRLEAEAQEMLDTLRSRKQRTDAVVAKLAGLLNAAAPGGWVLFKSTKPFASTPNDTDWFPLDPKDHKRLCQALLDSGEFVFLEKAPRQTTLIEKAGQGVATTEKVGGVYYIDCYVIPSTDYFVYLNSRKLTGEVLSKEIGGVQVPVLSPEAELTAILFHNVFPEKSFSLESFYLVKCYLEQIEARGGMDHFVRTLRQHAATVPAVANLAMVRAMDRYFFDAEDARVEACLAALGAPGRGFPAIARSGWAFPHEFSNKVFWSTFAAKQRDPAAFFSTLNQGLHMLNPVFFADVVQILWKRCVKGGVYQQQ